MGEDVTGSLFVDQGSESHEAYEDCFCALEQDQGLFTAFYGFALTVPAACRLKKMLQCNFS